MVVPMASSEQPFSQDQRKEKRLFACTECDVQHEKGVKRNEILMSYAITYLVFGVGAIASSLLFGCLQPTVRQKQYRY